MLVLPFILESLITFASVLELNLAFDVSIVVQVGNIVEVSLLAIEGSLDRLIVITIVDLVSF